MPKTKKMKYLDPEEKDLENAIKSIDIKSLSLPNEIVQNKFKLAARNFMKDETKMIIYIDSFELDSLKKRAKIEGLQYQFFARNIIHKYLTGQFIEKTLP